LQVKTVVKGLVTHGGNHDKCPFIESQIIWGTNCYSLVWFILEEFVAKPS
jgi:hypothetical protein